MAPTHSTKAPHFCTNCGAALDHDARFCGNCGTAIQTTATPIPPSASEVRQTKNKPHAKASPSSRAKPKRRGCTCLSVVLIIALIGSCTAAALGLSDTTIIPFVGSIFPSPTPEEIGMAPEGAPIVPEHLTAFVPPLLADIPITRGEQLAQQPIQSADGGMISTNDGLRIRIEPGNLDHDRTISISAIQLDAPLPISLNIPGAEVSDVQVQAAWLIDPGPEESLLPKPVEIAIAMPAEEVTDDRATAAIPAISTDGKHWSFPAYTLHDGMLVFQTRHLSEIGFFTFTVRAAFVAKALAVGIPLAMLGYIIYNRADELPECCSADAPYRSFGSDARGWEVRWSKNIQVIDEETYQKRIEQIIGEPGDLQTFAQRFHQARTELMPEQVRAVEEALVLASEYLKSRGFTAPGGTMRIYVVPNIDREAAAYYNPWLGRPYTMVGLNWDRDTIYASVLHEFFHFYQSGYVWYERMCDAPLLEASALLLEREARDFYQQHEINIWTDLARMDVFQDGLDGPACSLTSTDATAIQRHGYGLSWFLEYLRDQSSDPEHFHTALLREWSSNKTNALHQALVWAAGGTEADLAVAFSGFAKQKVLTGMPEQTNYGLKYSVPVFSTPYATGTFRFDQQASLDIDDARIKPWSIQFLDFNPEGHSRATLVIEIPPEWLKGESRRVVFVRKSPDEQTPQTFQELDPDITNRISMPFDTHRYLYIVDTGQTGSGWIFDNSPAMAYVLEPPSEIMTELDGSKLILSWEAPALVKQKPELVRGYAIYLGSSNRPLAEVEADKTSAEVTIPANLPPEEYQVTIRVIDASQPANISKASVPQALTAPEVEDDCDPNSHNPFTGCPVHIENDAPTTP